MRPVGVSWFSSSAIEVRTAASEPTQASPASRRRPPANAVFPPSRRPSNALPSTSATPRSSSHRSALSSARGTGSTNPPACTVRPTPKTKNPDVRVQVVARERLPRHPIGVRREIGQRRRDGCGRLGIGRVRGGDPQAGHRDRPPVAVDDLDPGGVEDDVLAERERQRPWRVLQRRPVAGVGPHQVGVGLGGRR